MFNLFFLLWKLLPASISFWQYFSFQNPVMLHRHFKLETKLLRFQNTAATTLTLQIKWRQNDKTEQVSWRPYFSNGCFICFPGDHKDILIPPIKNVSVLATAIQKSLSFLMSFQFCHVFREINEEMVSLQFYSFNQVNF